MQFSAGKLDVEDIEVLEGLVKHPLPKEFHDFYLRSNGGVPEKSWVITGDDYEPMQIADFKYIAKRCAIDIADTSYIGGCYSVLLSRGVIPKSLLPFAVDDGGNFFCLDVLDGTIVFYAVDAFRPEKSLLGNRISAQRTVAHSFSSLLNGLKSEPGMDC